MIRLSEANGFFDRLRGYMFSRAHTVDTALLFTDCRSIHTCFMFFRLSVFVVDDKNKVVQVEHNIRPWSFRLYSKGQHIVEVPTSQLEKLGFGNIKEGDQVHVES